MLPAEREPLFTGEFRLVCGMHFSGGMALSLYILFPLFMRQLGGSEFSIRLYPRVVAAPLLPRGCPWGTASTHRDIVGSWPSQG
jgi:hypothetical protein